jgi:hypothetical protein
MQGLQLVAGILEADLAYGWDQRGPLEVEQLVRLRELLLLEQEWEWQPELRLRLGWVAAKM